MKWIPVGALRGALITLPLILSAPVQGGALQKATVSQESRAPTVEWKPPYTVLPLPKDAAILTEKLQGNDSAVWLDGEILTFLHRDAAARVDVTGGVQLPMQRFEGTNLWALQLKMPDWDRAFLSYAFVTPEALRKRQVFFQSWFGANAPARPVHAEALQGALITRTMHSNGMNQDRKLTVYLPPNASGKDLPAFFMADGQGCESFARVLEPLILAGKVRPVAIVGVHSGEYDGPPGSYDILHDHRALEYLPAPSPRIFAAHLQFFTQEVPDYVAKEFHISRRRQDRALFGFSNGGTFAAVAALRMPEVFGSALPFSTGIPALEIGKIAHPPAFHFVAGELEPFLVSTRRLYETLQAKGLPVTLKTYKASHDPEMWQMAFCNLAPLLFPGPNARK